MPLSTASLEKDLSSADKQQKPPMKAAALQYLIQPSSVDIRMLEGEKSKHKT